MAAMDPNKNYAGKAARAERRETARREEQTQQVRSVARGRRGI